MDDIKKARQKKELGITTEEFWEESKKMVEDADQAIVIVVKDGLSSFIDTGGNTLELMGALNHALHVTTHNAIHWEE